MMIGPDWTKLFAEGNCLYYGEPFSDEQWDALNNAATAADRENLVNKFREEYLKEKDMKEGKVVEAKAEIKEEAAEEVAEEKPAKAKKGK